MANVITQFLIGIGYDYDDKGERQAKAGMESIKSSTLAIGSALASVAIGAGVRVDQLAEKSRKLQDQLYRTNTQTTWVQGYGAALTELGGNADDAVGRITGIEEKLAAIRMGDTAFLDSLGRAGFKDSIDLGEAKSAQDFITRASEQFARATHTQQVNMANVLGLTDAEFKLWQQGGSYIDEHSRKLADQLGYTESLNQKQYEYSQSWVELNLELDKAANTISNIMLRDMTNLTKEARDFVGTINNFAGENPEETKSLIQGGTAVGISAAILTGGKILSKIPGLSSLGRFAGPVGAAVGGGLWANSEWDKIMEDSDNWYGKETTGAGNFKLNSPLGKVWDYSANVLSDVWSDLSAPPPMLQSNDRHATNVERNRNGQTGVTSQYAPHNDDRNTLPISDNNSRLKPTSGAEYTPYVMTPQTNDYEKQNEHLARTLRETPVKIENKLNMSATVELNGQKMGEFVDTRIDEHNQQSMTQFDTQVSR